MAVGNFAAFFLLTFALQNVLGYPPLQSRLAFPLSTAAIIVSVRLARRFLVGAPIRFLLVPGSSPPPRA